MIKLSLLALKNFFNTLLIVCLILPAFIILSGTKINHPVWDQATQGLAIITDAKIDNQPIYHYEQPSKELQENRKFVKEVDQSLNAPSFLSVQNLTTYTTTTTTLFIPTIHYSIPPTITLAYSEDFSSGTPWLEFSNNGCLTKHQDQQFWIDLDSSDRTCLPPVAEENKPETPYRTYGIFEVDAYHSEGESEAWLGLFINGAGGDNYYLFRIQPNENDCVSGGDWELTRRKDGDDTVIASGTCHPSIKRGYGIANTNSLKISHETDLKISVFINGTLVGIVNEDAANHLTGTGVGIYARSDNKDVLMKFDNYTVYKYN